MPDTIAVRQPSRTPERRSSGGFTLTEMLVVIGIIALLIGILLVALSAVQERARKTQTTNLMEEFGKACETFQQQFGFYPGLVPEAILAGDPKISGTENAILHLCGGGVAEGSTEGGSVGAALVSWIPLGSGSAVQVALGVMKADGRCCLVPQPDHMIDFEAGDQILVLGDG